MVLTMEAIMAISMDTMRGRVMVIKIDKMMEISTVISTVKIEE